MSDVKLSFSIPLDENGYIELECDFCKTRFMILGDDFENKDMPFFFCPVCGLPNDLTTFYCPEVLEMAHQMAMEWAMKEINQKLGKTIKQINKNSSLFKIKMDTPKIKHPKELYKPVDKYIMHTTPCCHMDIKVRELDEQIGVYCPICGGSEI